MPLAISEPDYKYAAIFYHISSPHKNFYALPYSRQLTIATAVNASIKSYVEDIINKRLLMILKKTVI